MARVILAMANSSMTRCGRLLLSAIARGTALGSTLSAPRCAAPDVVTFALACFIGEEMSALLFDFDERAGKSETAWESRASIAAAASDLACAWSFLNSCSVMPACLAACLGWGYS